MSVMGILLVLIWCRGCGEIYIILHSALPLCLQIFLAVLRNCESLYAVSEVPLP